MRHMAVEEEVSREVLTQAGTAGRLQIKNCLRADHLHIDQFALVAYPWKLHGPVSSGVKQ